MLSRKVSNLTLHKSQNKITTEAINVSDQGFVGSGLRILLVEDSLGDAALVRIAVEKTKERRQITIKHFESLSPALEFLKNESVDAVILDLSLPDSSGMEGLSKIKAAVSNIPVIIFTGYDDRSSAVDAIRSGAQDYLFKDSFDYTSIISAIDYAVERQKIQNAVEGDRLQKQQENQFRQEILNVVAHDLRSPLAGVLMQLQGILDKQLIDDLTPEQLKLFQQMYNNCDQVLQLSRGLLDLESLKSKRFLTFESVDLANIIRKTFDLFIPLSSQKAIQLKLEIDEKLPKVDADPKRIAQALNNLLSNALKFSHRKTKVFVSVGVRNEELVISVKDHGQGIPKEDLSKLFVEFSRTRVRPTAGEDSTGIGLAIVRLVAEAHGGRAWVESKLGHGSTFSLAIPLRQKSLI